MPAPPAHQRIADDLRARITSGELKPGTQLPSQRELADQWHCSLTPVRAALTRLEIEGLIESRQGVGAFVAGAG
jgi:GntR family transcriptional regulator